MYNFKDNMKYNKIILSKLMSNMKHFNGIRKFMKLKTANIHR